MEFIGNNILNKIRNKYILKNILFNLDPKIYLSLIKYNKAIQKRIDININDYKEYLQIDIEIEINQSKSCKKNFMNILNKNQ